MQLCMYMFFLMTKVLSYEFQIYCRFKKSHIKTSHYQAVKNLKSSGNSCLNMSISLSYWYSLVKQNLRSNLKVFSLLNSGVLIFYELLHIN